jgi:uncharacterized protein
VALLATKLVLLPLSRVPSPNRESVWEGYKSLPQQYPAIGDDVGNTVFLILFRPGPKWLNDRTVSAQPLQPHAKYMQQLYDQGKLILAGPFLDNSGRMAIVSVSSEEDLRQILASEPATLEGISLAETHPWYLLFDAKRGRSLRDRSGNSSSPCLGG